MLSLNLSKFFFMMTLSLGTLISISSSSWFTVWLGLELNLLSFIPLISSKTNTYSSEAALKYFLVQALGSCIILASAPSSLLSQDLPKMLIVASLLLKMGAAPLHFWLPSLMEGLSWPKCFILLSIQKIAPMMLILMSDSEYTYIMIMMSSIASSFIGSVGGLNQTLLRKIMAYSSINHMAWMLAAICFNETVWKLYFIVYCIISFSLVMLFFSNNMYHFTHLSSSSVNNPSLKLSLFMSFMSLGGLPPFFGFIPKLSLIQELVAWGEYIWLMYLLMSTLITLFFYLRIMIVSMTLSSSKIKISFVRLSSLAAIVFVNFFPLISLWSAML